MLLRWTLIFLVLAIITGSMGFGIVAVALGSVFLFRILFFIFLGTWIISLFMPPADKQVPGPK